MYFSGGVTGTHQNIMQCSSRAQQSQEKKHKKIQTTTTKTKKKHKGSVQSFRLSSTIELWSLLFITHGQKDKQAPSKAMSW